MPIVTIKLKAHMIATILSRFLFIGILADSFGDEEMSSEVAIKMAADAPSHRLMSKSDKGKVIYLHRGI